MSVGKKLRFEIFRRDNFACRYCGKSAMDGAVLEPDHVVPRARGGEDVATNLVTACEGCNSGKSDTPLFSPVIEDVPQELLRAVDAEPDENPWWSAYPEWAEDIEIGAAIAFSDGWMPGPLAFSFHGVSVALAICSGRSKAEIMCASEHAGAARLTDIDRFLPPRVEPPECELETTTYNEALASLRAFVPIERQQLIWHARLAASDYQPTERELIRAAATISKRLIEEHGRDAETLSRFLHLLPDSQGSQFLMRATAEWDAVWQGRRGHSAWECSNEVLQLAVASALKAEVTV